MCISTQPAAAKGAEDFEATYHFPAEKDGWCVVHASLEGDMQLIVKALAALSANLEGGKSLEQWQVNGVHTFWAQFVDNVHKHHEHEEDIFFPWMASKIEMPPRVAADHAYTIQELSSMTQLVEKLSPPATPVDNAAIVSELQERFPKWQAAVVEHFREEETLLLPQIRQKFPYKELNKMVMTMVKNMGPWELPSALWHKTDPERREWMTQEKIPGFAQTLFILPKTRKYGRRFIEPIQAVIDGKPPAKKGLFAALFP